MTRRKKKINMYLKSQREGWTQACILYARKRATRFLGPTAYHQCDESCWHEEACDQCKFQIMPDDMEWDWGPGTPETCAICDI